MAHPRKELRDAVVASLIAADTLAGVNVVPFDVSREDVQSDVRLGVTTPSESSQLAGLGLPLRRDISLKIIARVPKKDDDAGIDRADELAEEIEAWWRANSTFGGIAQQSILVATEVSAQAAIETIAEIEFTFAVRVQRGAVAT